MPLDLEDFKNVTEKERNVTFGYIRRIEREFIDLTIPMIIYQICTLFAMMQERWDKKWTHSSYSIIDDIILRQVSDQTSTKSTTAFLSLIVNKGIHCWTFKIIQSGHRFRSRLGIIIADENNYPTVRDNWFGSRPNTSYIWDFSRAQIIKHNTNSWGRSYGRKCKTDDTISMYLDFIKGTLSFSINNEESLGVAHKIDVNKKYRGGAMLRSIGNEIKLISYQRLE